MTAPYMVPALDEQRRTAALEMLRARELAYAAGQGAVFDLLTLEIFIARLHLAAADDADKNKHLAEVTDLAQRRFSLISNAEKVG